MADTEPLGQKPKAPNRIAAGRGPLSFPEPRADGKTIANSRSVEDSAAAGAWKDEQNMEARSFGEQQR